MLINGENWNELTENSISSALKDIEESLFFEFKEDGVSNKKIAEEIAAFANTYGGYVFIGVSDDKSITGSDNWNEQKITNVIHDMISPSPSFDIKRFRMNDNKTVWVIRVDEGEEPPYITNNGLIYERLSSSTCVIKDSNRLFHLNSKRADQLKKIEQKISIPAIDLKMLYNSNLCGYLDVGFTLAARDFGLFSKRFFNIELKELNKNLDENNYTNVSRVGESIIATIGEIGFNYSKEKPVYIPAGENNFLEIMKDGSIRLRILLINGKKNNSVNMAIPIYLKEFYKAIYDRLFGDLLLDNFIYAKKYEKLSVISQFYPVLELDDPNLKRNLHTDEPISKSLEEKIGELRKLTEEHIKNTGKDRVITDDRIPKVGLYTIDGDSVNRIYSKFDRESLVDDLFSSSFLAIGSYFFSE